MADGTPFAANSRTRQFAGVQRLVAELGRPGFGDLFLDTCSDLARADQITLLALDDRGVRCLLARRPGEEDHVAALCRRYARSFADRDTLLGDFVRSAARSAVAAIESASIADIGYRRALFGDAGLSAKASAIVRGDGMILYLNLYYADALSGAYALGRRCVREIGALLLELMLKHDALCGTGWVRPAGPMRAERYMSDHLPGLSERERQVCARILCGYGAEAIAQDLAVSTTTVKTFRRRAYAKLGIASQNELFARCAGLIEAAPVRG